MLWASHQSMRTLLPFCAGKQNPLTLCLSAEVDGRKAKAFYADSLFRRYRLNRFTESLSIPSSSIIRSDRSISICWYSPFTKRTGGKRKVPISSFFAKIANPSTSHHNSLIKLPRLLRKRKSEPPYGSCWNCDRTSANKPLKLLRISIGLQQTKIRVAGVRLNIG